MDSRPMFIVSLFKFTKNVLYKKHVSCNNCGIPRGHLKALLKKKAYGRTGKFINCNRKAYHDMDGFDGVEADVVSTIWQGLSITQTWY